MTAGRLNNGPEGRGQDSGSALILTVVLTSLLAIMGVLFVMAARLDKMGATATSESRELDFAVDTVVAQISEVLAADVPGVSDDQEYYDYPDANNLWLADLEPSQDADGSYYWRQISNLTGIPATSTRNVTVTVISERDTIADVNSPGSDADADGDGISDARWYVIPAVMSSKGKPMYAAVRIIDNGAMLNMNTGYWFDSDWALPSLVDGSDLSQVNVVALAGGVSSPDDGADGLLEAREITDAVNGLTDYENRVVWGYLRPTASDPYTYTPFDLSDELELRYRFILNRTGVDTRAEEWGRFKSPTISVPVDANAAEWFKRAADGFDPNYAYRHIATTYNMDRIITPQPIQVADWPRNPWKMVNVNRRPPDRAAIREAITLALGEVNPDAVAVAAEAAQITANLLDYMDDDDQVTVVTGAGSSSVSYYGFERPCIYISEIACHLTLNPDTGEVYRSYAIELYKPYFEDNDPRSGEWQLVITLSSGEEIVEPIEWSGTRRFHVMLLEDPAAALFDNSDFSDPAAAADTTPYDRTPYADPRAQDFPNVSQEGSIFDEGSAIALQRWVTQTGEWIRDVDFVQVPTGWMDPNAGPRSVQRDVSPHKCIRRLWSATAGDPGLGTAPEPDLETRQPDAIIQAHPANRRLTNIGELGMVFAKSAYDVNTVKDATPGQVLFDLMNPAYARVFNYLTVIDPNDHGWNLSETRVMGRININTAPWFVLAQLPWMQYEDVLAYEKAQAIVDYRDANVPYQSTASLMQVEALGNLAFDGPKQNWHGDTPRGPDLDLVPDNAMDDFEERDLLFRRISDLVTVRSDVFTAYILVRIGVDGPQKRMMAILDRSAVTPAGGKVRVIALHPVPDPR